MTDKLAHARSIYQAKRQTNEIVRLDPIQKAAQNPKSLRLAINAKCYDCQGRNHDPGVIDRIRTCEIPACSLYPVRPYQTGASND